MSKQQLIAIGRESGSGGYEIARQLAKRLNLPLYDKNLLEKIAEEKKRKMEEESRRIALEALEQRYCMNCFHLKEECICTVSGIKPLNVRSEKEQPLPIVGMRSECELDEPRY